MPTFIKPGFWKKSAKSFEGWLDLDALIASKGGGTVTTVDVTYDELVAKINAGTLSVGSSYKITDFRTIHYLMFNDLLLDPVPIEGAVEPLLVTAISTNKLDVNAKSVNYPHDVIHYDALPTNWLTDGAFAIEGVIVPGFKGVIYFRHDTLNNNSVGYDFRNVKFRRFKSGLPAWSAVTTYLQGYRAQDATGVYVSMIPDNLNNLLTDTASWSKVVDYSITDYVTADPDDSLLNSSGPTASADFLTFAELPSSGSYDVIVRNNHIEQVKDDVVAYRGTTSLLTNNVFFLPPLTDPVYFTVESNVLKPGCVNNTFMGLTTGNILETGVYKTCFSDSFVSNHVGSSFASSLIGPNFQSNVIGNFCYELFAGPDFKQNTVGDSLALITTGNGFGDNEIGSGFMNAIIPQNFIMNKVDNLFNCSWLDFLVATHIFGAYNCELTTASNGDLKLKYVDETGTQLIVAANA